LRVTPPCFLDNGAGECIVGDVMSNKPKSNKKEKPLALVNENGLTVGEATLAKSLEQQCPKIAEAFKQYQQAEGEFRSRFWSLAEALRQPQVINGPSGPRAAARLTGRQITVLLLSLGEIKQRVTEWKRVVEMDDETYEKCRLAGFSKVETLGIARGSLVITGEGEEAKAEKLASSASGEEGASEAPSKPAEPTFHRIPKGVATIIHALITDNHSLKATDDEIPYELKGKTSDGRNYQVTIFVDSVAVSE